jgi:MinD-like ATPase involved in chromosome partitioning or flagellar assembly
VIVAVCSDKGSPGVTTLATVLALVWEGERVLLEADPSGGDLSLRLRQPGREYLSREPTILTLAMAVRGGARGETLLGYAQDTSLGIAVIPGPPVAEAWTPMLHLWSQVADRIQEWAGTVIIDLGRLQPDHPGLALAQAADAVVLLTTATVDGLFHARERAAALERAIGGSAQEQRVGVVVRAGSRDKGALSEVHQVLQHLVPVVGGLADDPAGVSALLAGSDSAHLRRSLLIRSGAALAARIQQTWPAGASSRVAGRRLAAGSPVRLLRDAP